jgi:hypothetical protein
VFRIPESIGKISIRNAAVTRRNDDDQQFGVADAIHNSIVAHSHSEQVGKPGQLPARWGARVVGEKFCGSKNSLT